MHVALGGCLSGEPVRYGLTEDTGGHIAYVLGATAAQAARPGIASVEIVTRAFDEPRLGAVFARETERLGPNRRIVRLRTASARYLEKAELLAELPALREAFLRHVARGPRPDIIHAHFADGAELARAAHAAHGIPWVYSSHSLGLQKGGATGPAHADRIARETEAIREAHGLIASSRDEAERQIAAYDRAAAGRTYRVSPGVVLPPDPGPGRALRLIAPFLRDPARPILLAVARPVAKKNLAALIEAYAASDLLRARTNLVIVAGARDRIGDDLSETGRVTTDLFDRVDRHGLWGQVALPRDHDATDIRSLYSLAAAGGVFVNPALCEPFGLTVVEAAQSGVPVVATRNGGPPGILEEIGYGRVIDPEDPAAIAAACLALLDDPARDARAARAARIAERSYSWPRWAAEVEGVYRGLAPRPRPAVAPRRLLVSDMDGTLTGSRPGATGLAAALTARPELHLVIATGRPISEVRRVLARWALPEPDCIIASVGSEIWWRDGAGYRLDADFARRISCDWDADRARAALDRAEIAPQPEHEQRPWKTSGFAGADAMPALRRALKDTGLAARVVPSHGRFVDILPARAGKAAAAAHVAARHGLSATDCLAAGDSGNDRDLLNWAGAAVLPANALPEIADIAGPSVNRALRAHAEGVLDGLHDWLETGTDRRVLAAE